MPAVRRRRFLVALALAALATLGGAQAVAQDIKFIRIGTGGTGGTYFPVGALIANVISNPPGSMRCDIGGSCGVPGLIAAVVSTQGSVDNIKALMAGRLDLALAQANLAALARRGEGPFAGQPVNNLRAIANLYPEAVQVVVRRDGRVDGIGKLKGKRVVLGEKASGTLDTARVVLQAFGLGEKDVTPLYESVARASELLSKGEVDAYFMVSGPPTAAVTQNADRDGIALLPINGKEAQALIKANRSFTPTRIPANTYRGVDAIETLAVGAQLFVSASMPGELVHAITKSLWDPRNRKILDGGHPMARNIQLTTALDGLTVPLHPGAAQFYRENDIPLPEGM